jgi:restriction system protein
MNPKIYEEMVCEHFRRRGYIAKTTQYSGDYGVDVFAIKGKEKIAIQAKMFGGGSRKVNRQMIMELHGAKDYFDCSKAIIATNGVLMPDAVEVAKKLHIEILNIEAIELTPSPTRPSNKVSFELIWERYIMPLQGKFLKRVNGDTNEIVKVDWSEIERITSNGKKGKIKIEIFKLAVNKLLKDGFVTRDFINQNYSGRASSGIILILSQVPFFKLTENPTGLKYQQ